MADLAERWSQIFKDAAQRFNHYVEGEAVPGQSCTTCIRRRMSHPYTCNDGWPMGNRHWRDRGATCINWSDDPKCRVD